MPIYRGTTQVTPHRDGRVPDRVYRGNRLVFRAIIPVTPLPPTFHDGEPWVTLPTVEGVTYSVSGTPGYDASVTVTATAQAGYELVGTSSWTHTYGPPPRYQASENGGVLDVPARTWHTVASHTVSSDGVASGTWETVWARVVGVFNIRFPFGVRVTVDGHTVATDGPRTLTGTDNVPQTVTIPEQNVTVGQAIQFQAYSEDSGSNLRINSWSWNLS